METISSITLAEIFSGKHGFGQSSLALAGIISCSEVSMDILTTPIAKEYLDVTQS